MATTLPPHAAPGETLHTYYYAVRLATAADVPWMAEECAAFAECYGSDALPYPGHEAAVARLRALFDLGALAWVGEVRGGLTATPVGFLLAMPTPALWTPEATLLTELLWWVRPSHRASGVGRQMLDDFVCFAVEQGWRPVLTLLPGTPDGVAASLVARGFREAERVYVLEGGS